MRVCEIELLGVMTHAHSKVALPRTGIVLVTGPNGAGKSSLLEAVSVGGWEEPLRRKPVWSAPKASITLTAEVGREQLVIDRSRIKSKSALVFSSPTAVPVTYETKTKAQAALERMIGSHLLWRRTCVFSSSDADHFTLATDGERKKLLEDILGLERFDAAHALALKAKREAGIAATTAGSTLALAAERLQAGRDRLADALERLQSLSGGKDMAPGDLALLEKALEQAERTVTRKQTAFDEAKESLNLAHAEVRAAEKRASRIEGLDTCTLCDQSINSAHHEAMHAEATRVVAHWAPMIATTEDHIDALRIELRAANQRVITLSEKRGRLHAEARAAAKVAEQRATADAAVLALREKCETAADTLDESREAHKLAEAELINITAAEKVLSLTGVRSYLLGQALAGIEEVANTWLARVAGGGLELRLQPYAEKASGGVKDSISLEVEGAGGGHGYRAASGGERRRIDIALMLALAEIAEAAVGTTGNTLFFDEVFDALDGDGVDAACAVLDELAADRCVVVISHNMDLAARLNVTKHLTINKGTIS
jgi:DNA repair exonuclease SbcCD ATPase subunit